MKAYSLTKKQLAQILKVSSGTICNWLNVRYYDKLKELGYEKSQRVLLPKQVEFLFGTLDIDIQEAKKNIG
jgi:hypothetical protein